MGRASRDPSLSLCRAQQEAQSSYHPILWSPQQVLRVPEAWNQQKLQGRHLTWDRTSKG